MTFDRYGSDVLSRDSHPARPTSRPVAADLGLVVEDVASGWVGAIVRVEKSGGMHEVVLEDARGKTRAFPLGPGFWIEGQPVDLRPPGHAPSHVHDDGTTAAPVRSASPPPASHWGSHPRRTASGSLAAPRERAKVARASRILVEGRHDAELVEKVWGADLRDVGIVVELLDGVDNLVPWIERFGPSPKARLGVLVDHLVAGSKEQRIADAVAASPAARHVLILGHPYIDIWQAVLPSRVGLASWPTVPRGEDIKKGTLARLGWPHATQADIADGWQRILAQVRHYRDLDTALIARVEELIDFVTLCTS